jgi:hypothetical protein
MSSTHKIRCTYGFLSRVPTVRVIFEIGGAPAHEELARDGRVVLFFCRISANCPAALRQARDNLPTTMEFIDRKTPPRLGNLLLAPEVKERLDLSSSDLHLDIIIAYSYPLWMRGSRLDSPATGSVQNHSERRLRIFL